MFPNCWEVKVVKLDALVRATPDSKHILGLLPRIPYGVEMVPHYLQSSTLTFSFTRKWLKAQFFVPPSLLDE